MQHTDTDSSAMKVSVLTFALIAIFDSYDSLFHISLGFGLPDMFNSFAVISLFKFVVFTILQVRYLLTLWKARNREAFSQGWDSIRTEMSRLYVRFYGALVLGLFLVYSLHEYMFLVLWLSQLYWLPQIILDIINGSRNSLDLSFVLATSLVRVAVPLYILSCPYSVFTSDDVLPLPLPYSPSSGVLLFFTQALQVLVLYSQRRLGPRWFVPMICLPHVYNYYRAVPATVLGHVTPDVELGGLSPECVICMTEIDLDSSLKPALTPCNHLFHSTCLQQWMDVKMECPTCRGPLPPLG